MHLFLCNSLHNHKFAKKLIIGTNRMTNKLTDLLFWLSFSCWRIARIVSYLQFYNHSLWGVGCISSNWQSVTALKVKWIYINTGILADFRCILFESFIWNFIRNLRLLYSSEFASCFSRVTILFKSCYWHFWQSQTHCSIFQ